MSAPHVHQALEQIRDIRLRVLDRQHFTGYSGVARIIGGLIAFCGAWVMSQQSFPKSDRAHLAGWALVGFLAGAVNFGALAYWYLKQSKEERSLGRLRPVLDTLAPFFIGAVFSAVLYRAAAYELLFGIWMCVFGTVNTASRHSLPSFIYYIGWYYIACGTFYLFWSERSLYDPWPMALVFLVGECAGGIVFIRHRIMEESLEGGS